MTRIRSRALVALAALLALPAVAGVATAQQDTRPTVAVLYFNNNSIGKDRADFEGLGKGIADLLISDLASTANVRVVERDRIQALLQEQNLTKEGTIDAQTAIRLGRILGARHMIAGGFISDGRGTMVLTAYTIDVETGEIANSQRVQQRGDDVLGIIGQLSQRMSSSLRLPAAERRTGQAVEPAGAVQAGSKAVADRPAKQESAKKAKADKLDLRTTLLYAKALEAQDAGDRDKAVELYNQVLDRFPNLETARSNRDRLQSAGE